MKTKDKIYFYFICNPLQDILYVFKTLHDYCLDELQDNGQYQNKFLQYWQLCKIIENHAASCVIGI